jgi:hypothetical protein
MKKRSSKALKGAAEMQAVASCGRGILWALFILKGSDVQGRQKKGCPSNPDRKNRDSLNHDTKFKKGTSIMGKESIALIEEDRQEYLSDLLFELSHARHYLTECDKGDIEPDISIVRLLLEVVYEKIQYYQTKYHMKADVDDLFYLEDVSDFFSKVEEFRQSGKQQA